MSDIQRYNLYCEYMEFDKNYMDEQSDGAYVKYTDHLKVVENLQARIEELEESNKRKRAKIKSMESSSYDNRVKAEGIEEMVNAPELKMLIGSHSMEVCLDYAQQLKEKG